MWLTSSSIGRKLVMSLTGAFLILFLTFHALMNGVALFWPAAYNVVCEFLGANWYALIGSAVIALAVILHIAYATWLTVQNRKARGSERYDVNARPAQVEWSSKNMYILGLVILAFLVFHLIQFWAKMQFAEVLGHHVVDSVSGAEVPPAAGTWFLQMAFGGELGGLVMAIYLVAFVALWFHLTHGFWSMFQTCGWDGDTWMPRLKCIGNVWTTIVCGLFVAEAIVFTVNAKQENYTKCPELQQQYIEMYAEGDGETTAPFFATEACKGECCGEKADECCCGTEAGCAECPKAGTPDCCNAPAEEAAQENVTETVNE